MLTVGCCNADCIHNKNGFCNFDGYINVGDEHCNGCDEYLSYLTTPKYQEQYFVARKRTDELPQHRVEERGRKIEYKGYTFYTQSYDYHDDITQYLLTEGKTGYHCGTLAELQKPERWQIFVESVKTTQNVMELPLVVLVDGKYEIKC